MVKCHKLWSAKITSCCRPVTGNLPDGSCPWALLGGGGASNRLNIRQIGIDQQLVEPTTGISDVDRVSTGTRTQIFQHFCLTRPTFTCHFYCNVSENHRVPWNTRFWQSEQPYSSVSRRNYSLKPTLLPKNDGSCEKFHRHENSSSTLIRTSWIKDIPLPLQTCLPKKLSAQKRFAWCIQYVFRTITVRLAICFLPTVAKPNGHSHDATNRENLDTTDNLGDIARQIPPPPVAVK